MEAKQQYTHIFISSLVYTILHDLAEITMIQIIIQLLVQRRYARPADNLTGHPIPFDD